MSAIDSPRAKGLLAAAWVIFAGVNATLMYLLPGKETIPYHLIWASFALIYGLTPWSRLTTWATFWAITLVTGVALVRHATRAIIGWEECSEIVLMGVIAALLVWHVNRHWAARHRIAALAEGERVRAHNRELATRFGSHELRTRLTIARSFADLIRDTARMPQTRDDAAVVVAELDKATVLATNLMMLVRLDARPTTEPVDLDELVDSVVHRWVARADRSWRVSTSAGWFVGNAERLEAALDSLLENAVKFTRPGDAISITAISDAADVELAVEDGGLGIPAGELVHVTELFQVSSNAGERGGSGLGLPIVRAIVEARGGTLRVTSELGAGTRAVIRLPRRLPDPAREHPATLQTVATAAEPRASSVVT